MIDFIIDNKEWLFGGVGIALIGGIINLFIKRKKRRQFTESNYTPFYFTQAYFDAGDNANINVTISKPLNQDSQIQRVMLDDVMKYDRKMKLLF